jgi:hypothetical protein
MYRLVFVSLWTTYTVDIYPSLTAVQRDCAKRYGTKELTFARDTDGILKAMIDADGEIVVLNLYETESVGA